MFALFARRSRIASLVTGMVLLASASIIEAQEVTSVKNWIVLGAFPNPKIDTGRPCPREGFDKDFLHALGGESKVELTKDSVVKYKDAVGTELEANAIEVKADIAGGLDFRKRFSESDFKVVYAYGVIKMEEARELGFRFGSDDSAKVWINGKLVHEKAVQSRGMTPGEDLFLAKVEKGENRILVKVENGVGGWCFALEGRDKAVFERMRSLKELQSTEFYLIPGDQDSRHVFYGDKFPKLAWNASDELKNMLGGGKFTIRWFDGKATEIEKPGQPGLYIAYIELACPDGSKFRRSMTFCKCPQGIRDYNLGMRMSLGCPPKNSGISQEAWDSHKTVMEIGGENTFAEGLFNSNEGAKLLAYALEMKETDCPASTTDNPWIWNSEAQLALKRKIFGFTSASFKQLQPPAKATNPAKTLREGSPKDAGMKTDTPAKLSAVCAEWASAGEEPFTALVARNGVVVFHKAFGKGANVDNKYDAASITKAITGLLFAQFIEQGVMSPDDPIGKYLPDFPLSGEKCVTLRHCLTHTTGLSGHFKWGGVNNPWLDNVIANNLEPLTPGKIYNYNGMGFDLAGESMEMTNGKSVLRMFQENLFLPLGIRNVYQWDLACATKFSAEDLGKLGQMLLNKGSYGDKLFFSPETFDKITPKDLSAFYPDLKNVYGFGLSYMTTKDPDAGKNGITEDKLILGKNIIGHPAASSSVFRVDLEHNLVIIVTRNSAGKDYEKYLVKFLKAIEAGLD